MGKRRGLARDWWIFWRPGRSWQRGRVLVPGCGTGHDARVWAEAGFAATGCDIVSERGPAGGGKDARGRIGGRIPSWVIFLLTLRRAAFDWIFEHTLFCAIDPGRREDYVAAVLALAQARRRTTWPSII